jgi:hypothetical protein
MATGQTILTIGALVIFGMIAINVQQLYVQSIVNRVDDQTTSSAMSIGWTIAEEIQSYAFQYDNLDSDFGGYDNVNDPTRRMEIQSQIDELFYVTVDLSAEKELIHEQIGRTATIRVYRSNDLALKTEYRTAVVSLQ